MTPQHFYVFQVVVVVVVVIRGRGHLWSWLAYLAYPTEALKNKLLKRLCINFFYVFSILELKLLRCCFIAGKFAASGDKTLWLISKFQAKQWPNPENGFEAIIRLVKIFYYRLSPSLVSPLPLLVSPSPSLVSPSPVSPVLSLNGEHNIKEKD